MRWSPFTEEVCSSGGNSAFSQNSPRRDPYLILPTLGTQISTQPLESFDAVQCLHVKWLEVTKLSTEFGEKAELLLHTYN